MGPHWEGGWFRGLDERQAPMGVRVRRWCPCSGWVSQGSGGSCGPVGLNDRGGFRRQGDPCYGRRLQRGSTRRQFSWLLYWVELMVLSKVVGRSDMGGWIIKHSLEVCRRGYVGIDIVRVCGVVEKVLTMTADPG